VIKFNSTERGESMRKFLMLVVCMIFLSFGSFAYAGGPEEGLAVKNWKGEYIGSVKHVLTDSSSGNIVFIILSLGQEKKKEIAVPVRSFSSYDHESGFLVLNVSKEILGAAPEFNISSLKDPSFTEKVYQFFGLAPSWGEGMTGESGS